MICELLWRLRTWNFDHIVIVCSSSDWIKMKSK